MKINFLSDTYSGVNQEIIDAIADANKGYSIGYFKDEYTKKVREIVQGMFTKKTNTLFVSNGTAVNVLGLRMLLQGSVSSILCEEGTHIAKSEMGATEYVLNTKILTINGENGKITVDKIKKALATLGGHMPPIKVVAFSETTEVGTCYTPKEIKKICDFAHAQGMYVYVDGARMANALAYLKCSLKELMEDTGVDAFTIGGNKNGCLFGELLIFLNENFQRDLSPEQKQLALTFSKTRFFSCQFVEYFKNDLWLKNAEHANEMARYLSEELLKIGYQSIYPIEGNTVFIKLPFEKLNKLKKTYKIGYNDKAKQTIRLRTNFQMTKSEVDDFVDALKNC